MLFRLAGRTDEDSGTGRGTKMTNHEKAVNALVQLYVSGHAEQGDIKRIMRRYCPVSTVPTRTVKQAEAAIAASQARLAILKEARKRLGGAEPIQAAANRLGSVSVPAKSNHQMAVEALLEQGIVTQGAFSNSPETRDFFLDPEKLRYPLDQLDRIFRTAIEEGKANGAAGRKDQYGEEVAILECVSTLVEHAGGWSNRTPELKEFYSNLEGWLKDHKLRVRFAPSKAAVQ
jgi:hypothetical protein